MSVLRSERPCIKRQLELIKSFDKDRAMEADAKNKKGRLQLYRKRYQNNSNRRKRGTSLRHVCRSRCSWRASAFVVMITVDSFFLVSIMITECGGYGAESRVLLFPVCILCTSFLPPTQKSSIIPKSNLSSIQFPSPVSSYLPRSPALKMHAET